MQKIGFLFPCLLAACAAPGSNPAPLIPNEVIAIAPGPGGTLTVGAGLAIGAAYWIYDPLAPNWEIQEKRLDEHRFYLSLVMKRFNTGGDGDALSIVKRRAEDLLAAHGMSHYQIESLQQRIDSQTIGARRIAEAVLVMYPKVQALPPVGYPPILAMPVPAAETVLPLKAAPTKKTSKPEPKAR